MIVLTIGVFSIGLLLGCLRLRVSVLAPASFAIVISALTIDATLMGTFQFVVVGQLSLQAGYFAGLALGQVGRERLAVQR